MHFLDRTLPTAAENLALDEALLLEAEAGHGGEVLRLWEWPTPAVILGSGGRLADDVEEAACAADQVPLLRRSSGGGTVLLDRGCLLYTLVLNYDRDPALSDIRPSYRFILDILARALGQGVGELVQAGVSDLTCAGRKISGTAQQRKRSFLLHHGTLLYDMDLSRLSRYLREPPRQPEYRDGRPHRDFVTNLPLSREEIAQRLRRAWMTEDPLAAWPMDEVRRLVAEKYATAEWTRRR